MLNSKFNILKLDERLKKLRHLTGLAVQSLLFSKDKFTVSSAKKWASKHGYHSSKVDVTDKYIRLRQKPPGKFKDFRTISFSKSIKAIVAGTLKSKFVGSVAIKGFSKFSNSIVKSELDLKIPLEVELRVLKEGQTRDGYISREELERSLDKWSNPAIIDFHDMDDMTRPTEHKISERKGFVSNPRIELIDGEYWIVTDGHITDRYLAYLVYVNQERGKPLEISPEFGWIPYWKDGKKLQTNINPHLISIVDEGHIQGNMLKIKNEV